MKLHIQILIICLSSVLLSAQPSGGGGGGGGGLEDICMQAVDVQLCEETIGSKLGPDEKVTPKTALEKEVEALAEEAAEAVKVTTDAQATDPKNAKSYKVCSEMFTNCGDELLTAKDALTASDMATTNAKLSEVVAFFSTCDEAFEQSGQSCPIANTTARLKNLASNCLAIAVMQ